MTLTGKSCPLGELVIGHTHTHTHYSVLCPCNLPLCGVTSKSRVFCDKFGQIAIISFLSSASIWCLSAPPEWPRDPDCQTSIHTNSTHACIPGFVVHRVRKVQTKSRHNGTKSQKNRVYPFRHIHIHPKQKKSFVNVLSGRFVTFTATSKRQKLEEEKPSPSDRKVTWLKR